MDFYDKLKWTLGILMVFVLIVTTNLVDRNNFLRVKDSVTTIYEDRLVAKDFLFQISRLIHEKEIAVIKPNVDFFPAQNTITNISIQEYVTKFEQTKLRADEEKVLGELKANLEALSAADAAFVESDFTQKDVLLSHFEEVKENLYDLSKIQINEGHRQLFISKKAIDLVELFTQMEIYFLVFLAIIIQFVVIYNPKPKNKA